MRLAPPRHARVQRTTAPVAAHACSPSCARPRRAPARPSTGHGGRSCADAVARFAISPPLQQRSHVCAATAGATRAAAATAAAGPGGHGVAPLQQERAVGVTYLEHLQVQDFALVAEQELRLQPGLNVITGESGSGKSVMVEALGLLLGGMASAECVRPPAPAAHLAATFQLSRQAASEVHRVLEANGLPASARPPLDTACELVLKREVSLSKGLVRSRCLVNGAATSQRVLRELGEVLVDANGQHAALALKDGGMQLALLDRAAGTTAAAAELGRRLARLKSLEAELGELAELGDEGERERLQAVCDLVAKLRIVPGEEEALRTRLRQMEARRSSLQQCALVRQGISGGSGGVISALRSLETHLRDVVIQEKTHLGALFDAHGERKDPTA